MIEQRRAEAMAAFFSFLHFVAAFALVAALTAELILIREELSVRNSFRILVADLVYGMSAGVVLVAGLLRVFYFEKGTSYYFASIPFLVKAALFLLVAAASIYPTFEFLSWYKPLRQGRQPLLTDRKRQVIRSIIHWELAGILAIVLCAALMAKGVGRLTG
jgi:putative membrane protein